MGNVTALTMDVITEKSGHTMVGMAVSVCLTPAAPAPLPLPYPTVATVSEGVIDECMRTKIDGAKVLTVGSCTKNCHGNEPGTLKEVVSLNTAGPSFPIIGAPIVFFELGMAGITLAFGMMNKNPVPGGGNSASGAGSGGGGGGGAGGGAGGPPGANSKGPSNGGGGGGGSNSGAAPPNAPAAPGADGQASGGHPVDVVTGALFTVPVVDFELRGPLPLQWVRSYRTSAVRGNVGLGWGWSHAFAWRAEESESGLRVIDSEGSSLELPHVNEGETAVGTFGRSLRREGDALVLASNDGGERVLRPSGDRTYRMTELRDGNGNTTEVEWDGEEVVAVTDCVGRRSECTRSPNRRVWSQLLVDGDGHEQRVFAVSYELDQRGDLVRVVDRGGATTEYAYDDEHFLVRERLSDGLTYHFVHADGSDGKRRCVETWGDLPGRDLLSELSGGISYHPPQTKGIYHVRFTYSPETRETSVIDGMGGTHHYTGNELGQVLRYVDPKGHVTVTRYDEHGALLSTTSPLHNTRTRGHDRLGRVVAFTDPLGRRTLLRRDAAGHVIEAVDPMGATWKMSRDRAGNLLERTDPLGRTTRSVHDERGMALETSGPGGSEKYERDAHGNPITVTDVEGATWRYTWDMFGFMTRLETPRGASYALHYDSYGNIVRVEGPLGQSVLRHYDPSGRLLAEQHPSGGTSQHVHLAGCRVEHVYPNGERFRYGYDAVCRVRWIESPAGERHLFDYDETHCLVREISFAGLETRYEHDAEGRRIREIRPNGSVVELRRDAVGQVITREIDGGQVEQFDRDMRGAVVRASTPFASITFVRDAAGILRREIQSTAGWEFAVDYEKDPLGYTTRRRYSTGWGVRIKRGTGGVIFGLAVERGPDDFEEILNFDYQDRTEIIRRPLHGDGMSAQVDALGRRTQVELFDRGGAPTRKRTFEWNVMPAVSEVRDSQRGARRYEIDLLARPTRARGLGADEQFTYSPHGTPQGSAATRVGKGGRVTRTASAAFQWDAAGRLQSRTGDAPQRSWAYRYDHDDRLVEAHRGDGYAVRYHYDPCGRRLAATGNDGRSTFFGWDAQSVVEVRHTGGKQERRVFRDDGYTPLLDSQQERGFRLVATDGAGTPWAYLGDGESSAEVELSTWGSVVHESGEIGSLRFAGQQADPATGLHYNRHRHYAPDLGLYLTPDPLGLTGTFLDLGFVPNPTGFLDPLGLIIINAVPSDDECNNGATARSNATGNQRVVTAEEVRAGRDRNGVPIDLGNLPPGEGVEVITHGTRNGGQVVWDDGTPPAPGMNHRLVNGRGLGNALKKAGLPPGTPVTVVACNASMKPKGTGESTIEGVNAATGAPTTGPSGLAFIRPDPQASPGTSGTVDTTTGQWDTASGPRGGTPTVTPNSPPTTHPGSW